MLVAKAKAVKRWQSHYGRGSGAKKRPDDLHQAVSNHQSRLSLIDLAVLILARVFVSNRGDDGYDAKCDCN